MTQKKALSDQWRHLSDQAGLIDADELGATLIACYSEPLRRYHNLDHLQQMVVQLAAVGADERILLAAWFHDSIYAPGRSDNELRSADFAGARLRALGYPETSLKFVREAIASTASHSSSNPAFANLLDADLSVLGAPTEAYEAYRIGIRHEYANVPEQAFVAGRMAFVSALLQCESIFRTERFCRQFEFAARTNLRAELSLLQKEFVAVPCY